MAVTRQDEIIEKAVASDSEAVPRYNGRAPDGTLLWENVALELANEIAQQGTPITAGVLNEMLAASGVTGGTAVAYTLAQEKYALIDGAPIRFRLHVASGANPTLNINGTGAKSIVNARGIPMDIGTPEGTWITACYSSIADAYVISNADKARWATVTASVAGSIRIALPDAFKTCRITADFTPSKTDVLFIDTGVFHSYISRGIDWSSATLSRISSTGDDSASTRVINTGFDLGVRRNILDLIAVRDGNTNYFYGTMYNNYCFMTIATVPTSQRFTEIQLTADVTNFPAGQRIIVEGIA